MDGKSKTVRFSEREHVREMNGEAKERRGDKVQGKVSPARVRGEAKEE